MKNASIYGHFSDDALQEWLAVYASWTIFAYIDSVKKNTIIVTELYDVNGAREYA